MADNYESMRINQRWWDDRGPAHAVSEFYDLENVVNGEMRLGQHEIEIVGDVRGKKLIHLQCHLGDAAISWARLGANVSGLDFSSASLSEAQKLAGRCGLDIDFRYGNVYDAVEVFENQLFDIVYVNTGSLHFLPDIKRWGQTVGQMLDVGGILFVDEIHPISSALAEDTPRFDRGYFETDGQTWDEPGSYADLHKHSTVHNEHIVWDHTISDIIGATIGGGLTIDNFSERHGSPYQQFNYQELDVDGIWRNTESYPQFPSMYSLKATKREA